MKHAILSINDKRRVVRGDVIELSGRRYRIRSVRTKGDKITVIPCNK